MFFCNFGASLQILIPDFTYTTSSRNVLMLFLLRFGYFCPFEKGLRKLFYLQFFNTQNFHFIVSASGLFFIYSETFAKFEPRCCHKTFSFRVAQNSNISVRGLGSNAELGSRHHAIT